MKKALKIILQEQEIQQMITDIAWKKFKECKEGDKDYNKLANEYYYQNGMNNEILVIKAKIERAMNK